MKRIYLAFAILVLTISALAQKPGNPYSAIDKKALEIPSSQTRNTKDIAAYINANFSSESDKVRAIFVWVASNLSYDVENMFAVNMEETLDEKIDKTLRTRKGICVNYAAIFTDICHKCGMKADIVTGYTRQPGYTSYMRHGWCAVRISGQWALVDPTWGSGVIIDEEFSPGVNDEYFRPDPKELIATHMPYDPMWQMLHFPLTNKEFASGKVVPGSQRPFFNYPDTIELYENLDDAAKLEAEMRRLEQNGVTNEVVYDRIVNIKTNMFLSRHTNEVNKKVDQINKQNEEMLKQGKIADIFNSAVAELNRAINEMNDFISYRNKQFVPAKADAQIQAMLDSVGLKMGRVDSKIRGITGQYDKIDELIVPLKKTIDDASKSLEEQRKWLASYFSKPKTARKAMFYKRIPLD